MMFLIGRFLPSSQPDQLVAVAIFFLKDSDRSSHISTGWKQIRWEVFNMDLWDFTLDIFNNPTALHDLKKGEKKETLRLLNLARCSYMIAYFLLQEKKVTVLKTWQEDKNENLNKGSRRQREIVWQTLPPFPWRRCRRHTAIRHGNLSSAKAWQQSLGQAGVRPSAAPRETEECEYR